VGVSPQNALVEWRDLPHPPRLRAIAEASLRRFFLRTAAEGGLRSPASGRGGTEHAVSPGTPNHHPNNLTARDAPSMDDRRPGSAAFGKPDEIGSEADP